MKWTNALGTITAVITLLLGAMTSLLHCSSVGGLQATCTGDILPAAYMGYAGIAFGLLTLVLKAVRPGGFLASLFGQTAVVSATPSVGTVTPAQVASK
ncbi:hypothetical protein UFOVP143_10 [uncultured Caudovirales phage]|uniref:Uncharacterized protein n=1 Tax=uncultured Caudovirales phage TaxID=2100421 RepID=A0A6J7VQB0_9CAUD|nr:hypothetical protein UFOVP143_10 [uncultured Caudovirales phage]